MPQKKSKYVLPSCELELQCKIIIDTYIKMCFIYFGAFKIPLALKDLTINGTDPNVIEIRTGAKTLWTA